MMVLYNIYMNGINKLTLPTRSTMMTAKIDDDTGLITLDEHELHDVVSCGLQAYFREVLPLLDGEIPERIRIVPRNPDFFPADLVTKWEDAINELIRTISTLDAEYHDDAEYTC